MRSPRRARPGSAALLIITLALVVVPVAVHPSTEARAAGAAGGVGTISTVAGGLGIGPALSVGTGPAGLLLRGSELIVADWANGVVRAIDLPTGGQRVIAGTNSIAGYSRDPLDGGPATSAFLNDPRGLAQDAAGNLYISEGESDRVRRIDPSGVITTVAGPGVYPTVGDGGPATAAFFRGTGVAVDRAGNLYIADTGQDRVRKVGTDGIITTVARVGATALAIDAAGDLLIADTPGRRILKLSGTTLTLVADLPIRYYPFDTLGGIAVGPGGVIYVTQTQSNRVMRVDPGGAVTTFAGNDAGPGVGPLGDGGPAVDANLATPDGVLADAAGNVYISDRYHYRVRRVDPGGTITTVAGNGTKSFAGDGGPALDAEMSGPTDIEVDRAGNIVFADVGNLLIRSVSPDGRIRTVAGNGTTFPIGGDGGPATAVGLPWAYGIDTDRSGNIYVADGGGGRVRKVTPAGIISTVAGTRGSSGSTGDGGPATAATIVNPTDVAVDGMGNVFITDPESFRIRKVDPAGIITTFAGDGTWGLSGDGGPATSAQLDLPRHLALDRAGNLFFTEVRYAETGRIRKIDAAGRITTFATNVAANDLAADHAGNLYVSDGLNHVVARYDRNGVRTVVAGNGTPGFSGDGGPALAAQLTGPGGVAVTGDSLYIGDGGNQRIRRVVLAPARAVAWGLNHVGQLGDGTTVVRSAATLATGGLADVRGLAGGGYHSVAVKGDGTVWTWGLNAYGQLGSGTTADAAVPARVPALTGVVDVSANLYDTLAVKSDGTVWAWGWNALGQLGTGDRVDRLTPTAVGGLSGVVAVAAGAYHSAALKSDGTVWAWGWNGTGQLGTGSKVDSLVPVRVPGLTGVVAVSAGALHTLALRNDGTVWSWGWNGFGQLGSGTTTDHLAPAPIPGLAKVRAVAAGFHHNLALRSDGTVWAWGWNALGQLGTGSTTDSRSPVASALAGARATAISAGVGHSLARLADGTVRAWGWNHFGQLGTGEYTDRMVPAVVAGLAGARTVSAGAYHSLASV